MCSRWCLICFTAIEPECIHKFLTTVGVQRLTECLRIVPQTELYKPCPTLQAYVREVLPWIQKQLYTEFSDTYNFLVESGIKARLAVMRFAEVCCVYFNHFYCWHLLFIVGGKWGFCKYSRTFLDCHVSNHFCVHLTKL